MASAWTRAPWFTSREAFRVGVVGDAGAGLTLGMEEALRSSALFGQSIEFENVTVDARRLVSDRPVHMLISTLRSVHDLNAVKSSARLHVLLNAGCPADELRHAQCGSSLFHVSASDTMVANASRSGNGPALLWHDELERFGAGQLNARFHARFRKPMTGDDWAAWMAVKIALEAWLRSKTMDSAQLRAFLERRDTRFDGHKGVSLSFRDSDHQLLQPMYIRGPDGAINQVPSFAGADPDRERALLDSLGGRTAGQRCG